MDTTATVLPTSAADSAAHDQLEADLLGFLIQSEWDSLAGLPAVPRDEAVVQGRRAGARAA